MVTYARYESRRAEYHGLIERADRVLKLYSIRADGEPLDPADFADATERAFQELPNPEPHHGRPGIGFLILHRGKTADYVILAWWAHENELPLRVYVRDDHGWRPARGDESVCVWDLEIICRERAAYVDTVLAGSEYPGVAGYLRRAAV